MWAGAEPGIVVVGGGWAGLSCATALAEGGLPVTVLEERSRLGGRACSFREPVTGEEIDNGQHLLMSCFQHGLRFLRRIGTADGIQFQPNLEVPLVEATGRQCALRCPPLPAPLHLLVGLLRHRALRPADKFGLLRSLGRIRRAVAESAGEESAGPDETTVEQWLDRLGQTPGSRRVFWHPLALATLNEDPSRASGRLFAAVLKASLMEGRAGSRIGRSHVPLSRLVDPVVRRYLERRGGRVIVNAPVARLLMEGGKVRAVQLRDGSEIAARAVVSAVPHQGLSRILPEEISSEDPFFGRTRRIPSSPILSIHLWYDRPVMNVPFVGLLDSPIHWIFDTRPRPAPGQPVRIVLVSSGARPLVDRSTGDLVGLADSEVRRYLRAARSATLVHSLVLKERCATFSPRAGISSLRPPAATPIPNLCLAGDWTDTGLPGTLESAALSGHRCAALIGERSARAA